MTAASSLLIPDAIATQNRLRSSRPATGGRPGEGNGSRPDRSDRRFRMLIATSSFRVLRRPIESAALAQNDVMASGALPRALAFRISVTLVTLWAVATLTLWFYKPVKAFPTLLAVLISVAALSFAARDGAPAEKSMNGIVTDWQDREPTAGELRFRDEAVRRCRGSGERESVQAGGSECVAYRDRDRIMWAIHRPHAIARGWATLAE